MIASTKRWKKLLLFCFGLALGTSFCMKWMEPEFQTQGSLFTIIGLELVYLPEKMRYIFTHMDSHVRAILQYHLYFDFAFMAGIYPGIAGLCMMAREKTRSKIMQVVLFTLACLQLGAWVFDVVENCYLLQWIKDPSSLKDLFLFHLVVWAKWIIAIVGVVFSLLYVFRKARNNN